LIISSVMRVLRRMLDMLLYAKAEVAAACLLIGGCPRFAGGTPYYYFPEGLWNQRFSG
jgi:hypothetical protein